MKKKHIPGLLGLFAASMTGLTGCILEPVKVYGPPPPETHQEQEEPSSTSAAYNPKEDIDKMVCVYGPPPFEQEEEKPTPAPPPESPSMGKQP